MMLIFALLVVYQLKHFLADYPLQRPWMLGKFLDGWKWVAPLAAHSAVHGAFTFLIAFVLVSTGWKFALLLAAFDFTVHFIMDRIKASKRLMGRWKPLTSKEYALAQWTVEHPGLTYEEMIGWYKAKDELRSNRMFWHALGIDQMVHHLTHYVIIWALVH